MAKRKTGGRLHKVLQKAIRHSGQSLNQLGRSCQVSAPQLSRFMTGKQGLNLNAVEKLCEYLGLVLVPLKKLRKLKGLANPERTSR
jgi:hypothetical protein